jgi:DNA polymerase III delta prime subunit
LPHAMAFSGAGATEKLDFAWAFAQLLVCEKDDAPCGACGSCLRVEARSSESVLMIAPEKNAIKLEAAHDVLNFLSLQRVSRARIVIIDQAHLLNPQAANALLKVVEEPPPETYFILVTPEFSLLLPTLRSRVQRIRFAPGEYVDDPDQRELRDLAVRFLEQAGLGQRAALEEAQAESKDREIALQFVRSLQRELRKQTLARASSDSESLRRRTDLWQSAYKVEMDLLANVDRSLLLENFFYRARAALGV